MSVNQKSCELNLVKFVHADIKIFFKLINMIIRNTGLILKVIKILQSLPNDLKNLLTS